eukprot:SRR837773.5570.p1 GENE.SRR837773.5570~~SRR837773.5570.p1  ORF type:complete len:423 (-),score=114.13 SRR837773.5570:24-1292(-)
MAFALAASLGCFGQRQLRLLPLACRRLIGSRAEAFLDKRRSLENMQGRESYDMAQLRRRQGQTSVFHGLGPIPEEQHEQVHEMLALARSRDWQEAERLLQSVEDPCPHFLMAALVTVVKSHEEELAWRIFKQLPRPRLPAAYNCMISMMSRTGRIRDVEALYDEMREGNVEPNSITYTSLITAYGVARQLDRALAILDDMEAKGLPFTEVEFGAALSACGRCHDYEAAMRIIQKMEPLGVTPTIGHWTSVLLTCASNKESERASQVWDELQRRGHQPDLVAYTCFASTFSGPSAMERVRALQEEMGGRGIKPHSFFYGELLRLATEAGDDAIFEKLLQELDAAGIPRDSRIRMRIRKHDASRSERRHLDGGAPQAVAAAPAAPSTPAPLPAGWQQAADPTTGQVYYWQESDPNNTVTWDRPC